MFEIWNGETANVIGEYRSKTQAFADVRAMISRYGADTVQSWILLHDDGNDVEQIAVGRDLVAEAIGYAKRRHALLVASIRANTPLCGRAALAAESLSMLRECA